jgi:hypothetical protein
MKTVMEQLMEIQEQVDSLKIHLINTESFKAQSSEFTPCCTDECTCGEPEKIERTKFTIQADANEPEFDSAGFSTADREPDPEQTMSFTQEELVTLAAKLMERVIDVVKEAVDDTCLDADNLVDLSMGYGYQIEVELDTDQITRSIHEEIDNTIELDNDSVENELYDILKGMGKVS